MEKKNLPPPKNKEKARDNPKEIRTVFFTLFFKNLWGFFLCFTKKSSFLVDLTDGEKDLINSSASVGAGF